MFFGALAGLIALVVTYFAGRLHGVESFERQIGESYRWIKKADLEAERTRAEADRRALDEARAALATLDPGTELAKGEALLEASCPVCGRPVKVPP